MHRHAGWRQWEISGFRVPYLQRSQDSQYSDGQGALLRWQNSKTPMSISTGAVSNINYMSVRLNC